MVFHPFPDLSMALFYHFFSKNASPVSNFHTPLYLDLTAPTNIPILTMLSIMCLNLD